ncbi:hypothetical protein DRO48_03075, partial [Candidatus Bathyarchaeota archaeon]
MSVDEEEMEKSKKERKKEEITPPKFPVIKPEAEEEEVPKFPTIPKPTEAAPKPPKVAPPTPKIEIRPTVAPARPELVARAIVMDNGSGYTKCGFSGKDTPDAVFPTVIGVPKYGMAMPE